MRAHLVRFLDDARGMQQRLRRDAADVQANAAERGPPLDERDLETQDRRRETRPCSRRDLRRSRRGVCRAGGAASRSAPAAAAACARARRGAARRGGGRRRRRRPRRRCRRRRLCAAGSSAASSVSTRSPAATLSPFLIATDNTVPARGAGTSIVALSVSSVTSGSSAAILSPGFTCTSMTSTAGKSPSSGIRTSTSTHGIASTSCPGLARISPSRVVKRTAFAPSMTR